MKPRVYLETTVPSYFVARPSTNAVVAGHQQTTREWWAGCHERFDLFISQFVLDEAARGNASSAADRLAALAGIDELDVLPSVTELAEALVREGAVPTVARTDSLHIAVAAVHGMGYLVTWNCRHIANAEKKQHIREVCAHHGWKCPEICTPEQLMPSDKGEQL